jgi:hypothetical protein
MGKYHPHGDSAIYDALVRMAQPFSLRHPLVDFHGNYGSPDYPAAAPRYTECRLGQLAMQMLSSIDEDTVDFADNYSGDAFAFLSSDIPEIMTRLQSVADSAGELPCPLVVMDTAPAAVLGAGFDPIVATRREKIVCNVGNFHTLAFRLGDKGIEGVFEHHTGEIDLAKLEMLIRKLADGSLKHQDVFDDMGHGALMYSEEVFEFGKDDFDVVVTGPRRSMFQPTHPSSPQLHPYFATPFGDMMIAGCFGLLAATAEVLPGVAESIYGSLRGERGRGVAPWDSSA